MFGRAIRGVAAFSLVTVVTPVVCAGVILSALVFLPLPATLPQPKASVDSRSTHVLDAKGNEIAVFKQFETSIPVLQTDIPQVLKDAVVAAEDRNFYSHGGIDIRGTVRAMWADITNQKVVQGGSTITQQYVKQAFTGGDRTIARKIREAILASQLDRQIDKDTILYRYLSTIFFGEGAYGVGAAAETYFRKPVTELALNEAALLAGVIPAPSLYSPRDHPAAAEARRKLVLDQMLEQGKIDQAAHDHAVNQPIFLAATGTPPEASTVVYPAEQQATTQPWFTGYLRYWLETHLPGCVAGSCPMIDQGGLKVLTTLDPNAEQAAEQEIAKTMGKTNPTVQMALVSVEPQTGFVKAMVGGRDFGYSQYNTAQPQPLPDGREPGRQPGSAFKPFVLAEAFEQGIQPTSVYSGAPYKLPNGEFIKNFGGESYGNIDLRTATWHSVNDVYVRVIHQVGVEKTINMANRLGAHIEPYNPSTDAESIALGVKNVTPLNMASAYGVFANHGLRAEPTPVLQVLDATGKVLIDNTEAAKKATKVIDPVVADNVTDVLKGVLTSGTAAGKGIDRPAAGKTGTATDAANAWFVGYTPTLSTAVWIGHLDCGASSPGHDCGLRNISGVREVQGGTLPAATWQRYMKRALKGVPVTEFDVPAPIQSYADEARRAARGGFDPGPRREPADPAGPATYVEELPAPAADAPTTSPSSTTTSSSSTTSTVKPPIIN